MQNRKKILKARGRPPAETVPASASFRYGRTPSRDNPLRDLGRIGHLFGICGERGRSSSSLGRTRWRAWVGVLTLVVPFPPLMLWVLVSNKKRAEWVTIFWTRWTLWRKRSDCHWALWVSPKPAVGAVPTLIQRMPFLMTGVFKVHPLRPAGSAKPPVVSPKRDLPLSTNLGLYPGGEILPSLRLDVTTGPTEECVGHPGDSMRGVHSAFTSASFGAALGGSKRTPKTLSAKYTSIGDMRPPRGG